MSAVSREEVINGLRKLADYHYQKQVWLAADWPWSSLDEDYCQTFSDTGLEDALALGKTTFGAKADQALRELTSAAAKIEGRRPPQEVVDDPKMQIVREKAAKALQLIQQGAA